VSTTPGPPGERLDARTVREWGRRYSNWERFGRDDERGTLNFITPERVLAALALPRIPGMTLLWRARGAERLFSFDYRWVVGGNLVTIGLLVTIVTLLASGAAMSGEG